MSVCVCESVCESLSLTKAANIFLLSLSLSIWERQTVSLFSYGVDYYLSSFFFFWSFLFVFFVKLTVYVELGPPASIKTGKTNCVRCVFTVTIALKCW